MASASSALIKSPVDLTLSSPSRLIVDDNDEEEVDIVLAEEDIDEGGGGLRDEGRIGAPSSTEDTQKLKIRMNNEKKEE